MGSFDSSIFADEHTESKTASVTIDYYLAELVLERGECVCERERARKRRQVTMRNQLDWINWKGQKNKKKVEETEEENEKEEEEREEE